VFFLDFSLYRTYRELSKSGAADKGSTDFGLIQNPNISCHCIFPAVPPLLHAVYKKKLREAALTSVRIGLAVRRHSYSCNGCHSHSIAG
jgi:hypothetical protein